MLSKLQHAYDAAIYYNDPEKLSKCLSPNKNINHQTSIKIYRNNTLGSLINALLDVYPICQKILGKDYFRQIAMQHVKANPSMSHNLNRYGAGLDRTINDLSGVHDELLSMPYLMDIAKMEWQLHLCYYTDNRQAFRVDEFSQLTSAQQSRVRFILADDIGLIKSSFDLYAIWQSYESQSDIKVNQSQSHLVIHRQKYKPIVDSLVARDYDLISTLKYNNLTTLMPYLQESTLSIPDLISKGWITGFYHD
jgi:hypothetical protein